MLDFDYQIYYNDIIVVNSAGNIETSDDTDITSPGYAHNIITVGSVACLNSAPTMWRYYTNSCYTNPVGISKPDISAPGKFYIDYAGSVSGTSYATPLVTASIALYCEYFYENISSYISNTMARAVAIASAYKAIDHENTINLDERIGSGIIDLEAMFDCSIQFFNLQGSEKTCTIPNVNIGNELQIALVWPAEAVIGSNTMTGAEYVANYDMYLRNVVGQIVAFSSSINNSVEYIRFTATVSGTYSLQIVPNGTFSRSIQFSLVIYK